jgi:hypothetical protein
MLPAAATGSVVAAVLISIANTIGFSLAYGFDWSDPLIFLLGLIIGTPIALIVGVPVGFAVSWLIGRTGSPSASRAAFAGALTGLTLAAAAIAIGIVRYSNMTEAMPLVAGMPLVGAISGLSAFRVHFRGSVSLS